jgi:hypothetical protein
MDKLPVSPASPVSFHRYTIPMAKTKLRRPIARQLNDTGDAG